MVVKQVPGKTHPRTNRSAVIVPHCAVVACAGQTSDVQFVGTAAIHHRILPAVAGRQIKVANVAQLVIKRPEHLGAQPQIQRQVLTYLPVVLHKESVIVAAVFVVRDARTAEAKRHRALQEILKVIEPVLGRYKEQLPVEHLRENLV